MQNNSYILISGATSDIGVEIAGTLAPDDALILHGRSMDKLEALKEKIKSSKPVELWCEDLSHIEAIKPSLKEFLNSRQLPVSGFVHCAGLTKNLPLKNFREDYMKEIFNVNFFSAVNIIQILLMKNNISHLNRIIFISSIASKRGDKGNTIYASSKGAIDSLVKSLAMELAPNVNVNSILPAVVKTKMAEYILNDSERMAVLNARYPLGYGQCKDIALMVQFLLGEGGRWITAQNYLVDGGVSMAHLS